MAAGNRHPIASLAAAAAVAVSGVAGIGTSQRADGSLIIDVRATHVNGLPTSDPKVFVAGFGDTVTFAIFAVLTGTNGINDETVQSAHGAILSPGSLLGTLSANVVAPFTGSGHQNGTQQDLDQDTDLDVGSGPNGGVGTQFFLARSNVQESGTITSANSEEIQIGTATFVLDTNSGPEVLINFARRANASGGNISTAATWFEDGTIRNPNNGVYGVGTPVAAWIPEPASAALAGLASIGLLARRRSGVAAEEIASLGLLTRRRDPRRR